MDRIPARLQTGDSRRGGHDHASGPTLKIDVTGVQVDHSQVLRGNVVRRVLLALSRFGPRVRKVSVCLAEPANPLGGVDQQCRMRAWLEVSGDIQAEAINGGMEAAVARAAARLAKRVDSALDGRASDGAEAPPRLGSRVGRPPASRTAPRRRRRPPARGPRRRTRSG